MGAPTIASQRQRRNDRRRSLRQQLSQLSILSQLTILTLMAGSIWFGYKTVRGFIVQPQAVLVLGGAAEREKFAATFAQSHPDLPIWISSGAPRDYSEWVFAEAGIDLDRLHLDYRAVDTLTNFTTLADDLRAQGITKVYLITSDYHMRRSRLIGEIILGSRGIDFQPVEIPSNLPPEDFAKAARDSGRALFWLVTGYTGYNSNTNGQLTPSPSPHN
jgi:uncharacterized SAM-binding protein YcdF (DUF218 family)